MAVAPESHAAPGGLLEAVEIEDKERRDQQGGADVAPLGFLGRRQMRDGEGRLLLKNLSYPELEAWCASTGESRLLNLLPWN